jgi:hypothetical protein
MLLGSLPVYLVIAPTCFSSALLLKAHEGPQWVAAGNLMLMAASIAQGGALFGAAVCIQNVSEKHHIELTSMPDDEEVKKMEEKQKERAALKKFVINWFECEGNNKFPLCMKLNLLYGIRLMSVSVYIFFLFPKRCFKQFTVTDSIDRHLDGNALNIVKPLGWISAGLFTFACVLAINFSCWSSRRMAAEIKRHGTVEQALEGML